MGILLAFAPFLAFALFDRVLDPFAGLVAGATAAAILVARDIALERSPKILEIGTLVLFVGMTVYASVADPLWSVIGVRLRVDAGLLLIVLGSIAVRRPFTLQYARERVPTALWNTPRFVRTNYVITLAWALAFGIIVLADGAMLLRPDTSVRLGIIATVAAIIGAMKFSQWYPRRVAAAG
ncbi:hypothetical protein [Variovorax sp. GT1P44]|uniref:hypothetical protein n=1 Tax=Variovorax sp. GT1P44 TaxID=3443742 RepID=UPI003F454B88